MPSSASRVGAATPSTDRLRKLSAVPAMTRAMIHQRRPRIRRPDIALPRTRRLRAGDVSATISGAGGESQAGLTRNRLVTYSSLMAASYPPQAVFDAIADPVRRDILALLTERSAAVEEI